MVEIFQRHEMATLERIAVLARALLAPHVSLELVDGRPFRPPHDVERHRLRGLAAEALHLEVAIAGVQRIAEGRGGLGRPLKGEHAGVPRLAGRGVGRQPGFLSPLGQVPDRGAKYVLPRFSSPCPMIAPPPL